MVRQRGYTLVEVVVAMAIFGIFLFILVTLTAEMNFYQRRLPVNMHKHPQVIAVLARLRRDVLDGHSVRPYRNSHDGYTSSEKVLIIDTVNNTGGYDTVVWDFRTPREVRRRAYVAGVPQEWVARGLPADFSRLDIDAVRMSDDGAWATHIVAKDERGRIAIDTILQPRATE